MTRAGQYRTVIALVLPTLVAMPTLVFARGPTPDGAAIYAGQCLACHGATGNANAEKMNVLSGQLLHSAFGIRKEGVAAVDDYIAIRQVWQ